MEAVTDNSLNGQGGVVQHRHVHEDRGNLKRTCDADDRAPVRRELRYLAAVKPDRSRIGHDLALELCDERGLAGAVRSDDRVNLPCMHGKADIVRRRKTAEPFRQSDHVEQTLWR